VTGGVSALRVAAADGVAVALHRVGPGTRRRCPPLLLAPGTFSTRLFWLGGKGQGVAHDLARRGFDPWIVEFRGHGASDRPASWTLEDWIRLDAPAAVAGVLEATGEEGVVWIGHSAGGVVGAGFAGSGHSLVERLAGLVLLGTPGPGGLRGIRRLGAQATRLIAAATPRLHWPGRLLRLGPEREPGLLIREWMRWNVSARWSDSTGRDYLAGLSEVDVPVLGVAGRGDHLLAPPAAVQDLLSRFASRDRTLIVAGREAGYSIDFGHPGLVIGRAARDELWPAVVAWLRERWRETTQPRTRPDTP
jgi:predicted alpha/beta hydrolase